ncbi:UDP-N-acetylmuramoyl-tripeptide--D-alanyl-D-alanine ligase [Candidatus Uhrbacteria bacterium]|nr:UDP-N-acetylmuramoyl-tripeptide--D-alanyl-D-alanine ligase [Candidatus Uhrbacteria bacterium]
MKKLLQRFLGTCARAAILRERPRVVAVAGSVGKSSTKEAIAVAGGAYDPTSRALVSPKNYNNELGIPLTAFRTPAPGRSPVAWIRLLVRAALTALGAKRINASSLVLEFGTDHPGDLAYLIGIAHPDVAVLTAIAPEHTEFFGSVEAVADEELAIIRTLTEDGVAILNADDAEVMKGKEMTDATVVTFGESPTSDVRLLSSEVVVDEQDPEASGLEVHIIALGLGARLRLRGVFGKPHALAAAAALAVVHALDIDFHDSAEQLKAYRGMPGRTRLITGIKRTTLLDDSYNSSPLAALSAVRDLAKFPRRDGAKRIAALGDMLELGALADDAHRDLGRAVAELGIDMLVASGTLAHAIADGAKDAGMPEGSIFVFPSSVEAGRFIQERLHEGDVVLIKGSQGARMEKITKELMAEPLRAKELLVRQTEEWQ